LYNCWIFKLKFWIRNKINLKKDDLKFEDIIDIINNNFRSKNSKESYDWIKRLTILHPNKRDGGILNCYLNDND